MHTRTSSRAHLLMEVTMPLLFLVASIVTQFRSDEIWAGHHLDVREPVHRFAMPATIVRHLAFGFNSVLADFYWVTSIQEYLKWDQHDVFYPEYFRIISALDPQFAYPYNFAILTVPNKNEPRSLDWLSLIAKDGIKALPLDWEIPFYTGVQYHIVAKSTEMATKFIEIADKLSTSPEVVHSTYAIYLMHDTSEYKRSRSLFSAIYETTNNEETKSVAKERIALLDAMEMFDQSIEKYHSIHHTYPSSFDALFAEGYLVRSPELTDFIKKFAIRIDQSTGKATIR